MYPLSRAVPLRFRLYSSVPGVDVLMSHLKKPLFFFRSGGMAIAFRVARARPHAIVVD